MKKIININFHGRVVPIEESAYEILKQYIDSLSKYFANEEGREEIINDIENRFAELFSERLKKGATCITDDDVNQIIKSMGRPEDFEQDDMTQNDSSSSGSSRTQGSATQPGPEPSATTESRRLYRSENDRVIGGVCGGLANYLRIDPAIVRIIFALITFGGFGSGILIYLILWVVVPSKTLVLNVRKRLYRNPDNRVIAGVASGLAAYFHWEVWVPRLIFSLPLIMGVISSIFRHHWMDFDPGPVFVFGGFGGTLFVTYIILWIVLPEAVTASEKLEMRGEKVDLESIKNTIKSDLEGFKGRAAEMGNEIKQRAQQVGQEFKQTSQNFASEVAPAARRTGTGLGHAIGVLFKAFFLFISGVMAFALIMVLVGLLFSGVGVLPFKNYLLAGFWQNFLAWVSLFLFFGIPVIALLTWLIRRIIGVRSRSHYLGYAFGSLWVIGLVCFLVFISMMVNNFRSRASVEDPVALTQPSGGKLTIKLTEEKVSYYGSDWFGINWDNDAPFFSLNEDSVMMTTVRVRLVKSTDSAYHLQLVRFAHGNNPALAKSVASQIQFNLQQKDSVLYLPLGFSITPAQKFRNQQVLVLVSIPVGKKILVDRSVDDYHWFNIDAGIRHRGWNVDWNDNLDNGNDWTSNVEYIMTENGIEDTHAVLQDSNDELNQDNRKIHNGYKYKQKTDSTNQKKRLNQKEGEDQKPAADQDAKQTSSVVPSANGLQEQETEDQGGAGFSMFHLLFKLI
jgi:phage shock protein PspC (stress-responsive transcriptional regulator)